MPVQRSAWVLVAALVLGACVEPATAPAAVDSPSAVATSPSPAPSAGPTVTETPVGPAGPPLVWVSAYDTTTGVAVFRLSQPGEPVLVRSTTRPLDVRMDLDRYVTVEDPSGAVQVRRLSDGEVLWSVAPADRGYPVEARLTTAEQVAVIFDPAAGPGVAQHGDEEDTGDCRDDEIAVLASPAGVQDEVALHNPNLSAVDPAGVAVAFGSFFCDRSNGVGVLGTGGWDLWGEGSDLAVVAASPSGGIYAVRDLHEKVRAVAVVDRASGTVVDLEGDIYSTWSTSAGALYYAELRPAPNREPARGTSIIRRFATSIVSPPIGGGGFGAPIAAQDTDWFTITTSAEHGVVDDQLTVCTPTVACNGSGFPFGDREIISVSATFPGFDP